MTTAKYKTTINIGRHIGAGRFVRFTVPIPIEFDCYHDAEMAGDFNPHDYRTGRFFARMVNLNRNNSDPHTYIMVYDRLLDKVIKKIRFENKDTYECTITKRGSANKVKLNESDFKPFDLPFNKIFNILSQGIKGKTDVLTLCRARSMVTQVN